MAKIVDKHFILLRISHIPNQGYAPQISGMMLIEQISSMRKFGEVERGLINPEVTQAIIFYDLNEWLKEDTKKNINL